MLKRVFFLCVIAATIVALAFGCGESDWKRCYVGDYISCRCESADGGDGGFGYAQCNDNATWSACVCNGQTPGLDASSEAGVDSGQHGPGNGTGQSSGNLGAGDGGDGG